MSKTKKTYFEPTSKPFYFFVFFFSIEKLFKFLNSIGNNNVVLYEFTRLSENEFELIVEDKEVNLKSLIYENNR
jgi:hypothetical protein